MQYKNNLRLYAILAASAFALNLVWEYLHLPLYTGYEALGHGFSLVVWASAGDVLYILLAVLVIALCKRDLSWIEHIKKSEYVLLAILGLCTAVYIEHKALVAHKWAYTAAMPTIFGIGLSPLLQMTILLPLSVYVARRIATR